MAACSSDSIYPLPANLPKTIEQQVNSDAPTKLSSDVSNTVKNYRRDRYVFHAYVLLVGCEGRAPIRFIMTYLFPIIFLICIFGNAMNIFVFRIEHMKRSLAVKMLAVKAIANIIFVCCLSPGALKLIIDWDPETYPKLEWFYRNSWPYSVALANLSGTYATW